MKGRVGKTGRRQSEVPMEIFGKLLVKKKKMKTSIHIYLYFYLYFISGRIPCTPNIPLAVKRIQCV